ncbi:hypothetical protein BLA29_000636 [Euroglyphus maynei]|uniref:Uncharacterized protein n=1 Tax=Euroglyphus maynei TaxID=6958 RepID=A0A1Y3B749_EURMA|nr:hypothetical protein BLA29_000636 [Euroglyphus maynei]
MRFVHILFVAIIMVTLILSFKDVEAGKQKKRMQLLFLLSLLNRKRIVAPIPIPLPLPIPITIKKEHSVHKEPLPLTVVKEESYHDDEKEQSYTHDNQLVIVQDMVMYQSILDIWIILIVNNNIDSIDM